MEIDSYAKIIWSYLKLDQEIKRCDCIFVPGSHDISTADYGIELYKKGYGKILIFSGGIIQNKPDSGIVFKASGPIGN